MHSIGQEELRRVFVFLLAHLEGRIQPSLAINANSPNKETNKHLDYNCTEGPFKKLVPGLISFSTFQIFLTMMVALPKLLNCCACASLKTGTLIIGSLNLVASIIFFFASIGFMAGSTVSEIELQLSSQDRLRWPTNCLHI